MANYTNYYRHTNSLDVLYALPLQTGAWSDSGIVLGDDSEQSKLYVFADLDSGLAYEIYRRDGLSPAEGDTAIGIFPSSTTTELTTLSTKIGSPSGVSVSADIAAVKVDTGNLVTRITTSLFSGITSLASWIGLLAGKTADVTTLAEIQATTAGETFDNTTDSLQNIKDTAIGGGGEGTTVNLHVEGTTVISKGT